jgi:hypothetical protein
MQRPSFALELLPRESTECSLQSLQLHISITGPVLYYQLKYVYQVNAAGDVDLALNLPEEAVLCEMRASQGERSVSLATKRTSEAQQLPTEAHQYSAKGERRFAFHCEESTLFEVSVAFATVVSLQAGEVIVALPYVEAQQSLQFSMQVLVDNNLSLKEVQPKQVTTQRSEDGLILRSEDPTLLSGVLRLLLSSDAPLAVSLPEHKAVFCALPPVVVKEEDFIPRQLTILLDCSGSMIGSRFESSRRMLRILCSSLWPGDIFSVKTFGAKPSETPLWAFEDEALQGLEAFLAGLLPRGGKELTPLLERVLSLPMESGYLPTILLVTDMSQESDPRLLRQVEAASRERGVRLHVMGVGDITNEVFLRSLAWAGRGSALFATRPKKIDMLALRFHRQCTPVATQLQLEGELLKDMYQARSYSFWAQTPHDTLRLVGPSFSKEIKVPVSKEGNQALRALWAKARAEELGYHKEQHKEEITQLGLKYLIDTPFTSWIKQRKGSQLRLVKKVENIDALHMPMLSRSRAIFFGKTPVYHLKTAIQRLPTVTERIDAPKDLPVVRKHQRERFEQAPNLAEFAPLRAPEPLKEFPPFSLKSSMSRFVLMRSQFSSRFSLQDRAEMALFFLLRAQRRDGSFSDNLSVTSLLGEVLSLVSKTDDSGIYQQPLQRVQAFLSRSKKSEVIPCLVSRAQLLDAQKLIGENRGGVFELGDPITMTAFLVRDIYQDPENVTK